MPLIIPEGYAQVVIDYASTTFDSGNAAVTFGFGGPLGDDPTSLQDFADVVSAAWIDEVKPFTDSQVSMSGVRVIGPTTSAQGAAGGPGGANYTMPPPNVAPLINRVTARRGRRGRGRFYPPGMLQEEDIDEAGFMTEGRRNTIATAWTQFWQSCVDPIVPGVDMVILQNDEPGQVTPPISPPPVVTNLVYPTKVATMRRRLRR